LHAIKEEPLKRKINKSDILDIINEWSKKISISEYDILDSIPYLPSVVLSDIYDELLEDLINDDEFIEKGEQNIIDDIPGNNNYYYSNGSDYSENNDDFE
jgi:hypothetical protein